MAQAAADSNKKKKIFDGRYEILSIVGRGSGSVVYRARHVSAPHNEVALKVLVDKKSGASSSDQLRKEALAMVSSRHKYTIRLDDFHSVGQLCYLAMEFAPEGDLRRYISRKGGSLPIPQIERFMVQLAEALAFIHQAGILHRDIKPDNLLVVNDRQIRLADFGVAVLPGEESSIEELQKGVGTMDYMAPEVLEAKESTKKSDVYLFGATCYEIITGVQPFANIPLAQVIEARKDDRIEPVTKLRDDCPEYLAKIVAKALSFNPNDRYRTARELFEALLAAKAKERQVKTLAENTAAAQVAPSPHTEHEPITTEAKTTVDAETDKPKKKRRRRRKRKLKNPDAIDAVTDTPDRNAVKTNDTTTAVSETQRTPLKTEPEGDDEVKVGARRPRQSMMPPMREPREKSTQESHAKKVQTEEETSKKPSSPQNRAEAKQDNQELVVNEEDGSSNKSASEGGTARPDRSVYAPPSDKNEEQAPKNKPEVASVVAQVETILPADEKTAQNEEEKIFEPIETSSTEEEFEGYSADDFYDSSTNNITAKQAKPSYSQLSKENEKRKSTVFKIIVILMALFFMNELVKRFTDKGLAERAMEISGIEGDSSILPYVSASSFNFPNLPAGQYSGTITGLIKDTPLPLDITRPVDSDNIFVSIGINGWTPAAIPVTEDPNTVRVRSSGFILTLSGLETDGGIQGTFVNAITGEEGVWVVTPIRKQ